MLASKAATPVCEQLSRLRNRGEKARVQRTAVAGSPTVCNCSELRQRPLSCGLAASHCCRAVAARLLRLPRLHGCPRLQLLHQSGNAQHARSAATEHLAVAVSVGRQQALRSVSRTTSPPTLAANRPNSACPPVSLAASASSGVTGLEDDESDRRPMREGASTATLRISLCATATRQVLQREASGLLRALPLFLVCKYFVHNPDRVSAGNREQAGTTSY